MSCSVAFSPDGKRLIRGARTETVRIWNIENPKDEPVILRGHERGVTSVACSPTAGG